ncbi:aminoglycoside phosphotransferase [Virgibacillus indicus]|uniref:Aminoglycoside phosphotransferase n=1 Tax=Virgibacillus indicus TaxID=2024554 RepID=A0A265NAQ2_9BACI|nr:aminoglycoside phosphotransferase family protein [Virgibacillus indicus]OZU88891.1 aminoglycoside phosphotransferase [Virgibacillus indicus]
MVNLSGKIQNWVINAVWAEANIVSIDRLKGSTSSTLHNIKLETDGEVKEVVIRQFDNKEWLQEEPDLAVHEAESLRKAADAGVFTPEIIAYDKSGGVSGVPLVLMSKLRGSVELKPVDRNKWLNGLAEALVKIHAVDAEDFPWSYFSYNDANEVEIPVWSTIPATWKKAIEIVKGPRPKVRECFIHRDYHPANVLWENGSVSGVVDWVNACAGPAGVDVGHCRWNLAMLYDVETADGFLAAYKNHGGPAFKYDPYWDLVSVIDVLFGPPEVYQGWVAFGVTGLTNKMMVERMDLYVESLVKRVYKA